MRQGARSIVKWAIIPLGVGRAGKKGFKCAVQGALQKVKGREEREVVAGREWGGKVKRPCCASNLLRFDRGLQTNQGPCSSAVPPPVRIRLDPIAPSFCQGDSERVLLSFSLRY